LAADASQVKNQRNFLSKPKSAPVNPNDRNIGRGQVLRPRAMCAVFGDVRDKSVAAAQ
jgi:hypothetical protein